MGKNQMNKILKSLSVFLAAGFITVSITNKALSDMHEFEFTPEKPYAVVKNPDAEGSDKEAVNKATYYGYRIFHQNCHVCHGKGARGSSFAPNLLDSFNSVKHMYRMLSLGNTYSSSDLKDFDKRLKKLSDQDFEYVMQSLKKKQ